MGDFFVTLLCWLSATNYLRKSNPKDKKKTCIAHTHTHTCSYILCFLLGGNLLTLLQIIYSRARGPKHAHMPRLRKCFVVSVMLLTNAALISEIIEQMTMCQVTCICHIQRLLHSHDGHKVAVHMQNVERDRVEAPQLHLKVEVVHCSCNQKTEQ